MCVFKEPSAPVLKLRILNFQIYSQPKRSQNGQLANLELAVEGGTCLDSLGCFWLFTSFSSLSQETWTVSPIPCSHQSGRRQKISILASSWDRDFLPGLQGGWSRAEGQTSRVRTHRAAVVEGETAKSLEQKGKDKNCLTVGQESALEKAQVSTAQMVLPRVQPLASAEFTFK